MLTVKCKINVIPALEALYVFIEIVFKNKNKDF